VNEPGEIWTIGHWTCPIPEFLAPLDEHRIELVADVRAHPGSRRNPQFGSEAMSGWLSESGIDELTAIARTRRVAIMCGEPMPWRCHRLLIANTPTAQGWTVQHLITGGVTREHVLGQWGATPSVDSNSRVTYPAQPQQGPPTVRQ
jgi:uncharacterized protein (DUF488 family)